MRPLASLGGISLGCALLLAGVQALTEPAIEANRSAQAWRVAVELVGDRFEPAQAVWRRDRVDLPGGSWLKRARVRG